MKIERAGSGQLAELTELWERSVRSSHEFLSEDDIIGLRGDVRTKALPALELYIAVDDQGGTLGFMGMHGNNVEALFIDPPHAGKGVGRALLDHARAMHGTLKVDVNEQNPEALRFYEQYGFRRTGRSATDSDGRPFPLLHLELAPAPGRKETSNDHRPPS